MSQPFARAIAMMALISQALSPQENPSPTPVSLAWPWSGSISRKRSRKPLWKSLSLLQ